MTSLSDYTHVICIIQSNIVIQHLLKLLNKSKNEINVVVINSVYIDEYKVLFKVNLESGSGSRTVCKFNHIPRIS